MDCSDFERYLEIYLDGKLGRTRTAILGRHLAQCRSCRARLDGLRSFEKDLHKRFRSMRKADSIWASIQDEALAGAGQTLRMRGSLQTEPPPALPQTNDVEAKHHPLVEARARPIKSGSSRRGWFLAGLGLIAAAAVAQPLMWTFEFASSDDPYIEQYNSYLAGDQILEVTSNDINEVGAWLDARLGYHVPVLEPPSDTNLVGALVTTIGTERLAEIVYDQNGTTVLAFVGRGQFSDGFDRLDDRLGETSHVGWTESGFDFDVVAPLEIDALKAFRT